MKYFDISSDLLSAPTYPGDPEPKITKIQQIEDGNECNLSALFACLHAGTHADAQSHFIEDGKTIDEMPLEPYIGKCLVVDFGPGPITGEDIERFVPLGTERLLIKSGGKAFLMQHAVGELAFRGIKLIGTDAQSISDENETRRTHCDILSSDIAILEGLNLERIFPGNYFLIAPPVKIAGADGAPVRAILLSKSIF